MTSKLTIIVDAHIPFIKGVLEPYANMIYAKPADMTPEMVKNADALIVRTRTHCNADLLAGSRVKFIATATIGFDHIDTAYCEKNNIVWTNAAGCNADAVRQYVQTVLEYLAAHKGFVLKNKTLGVVGVGHVGKRVAAMAEKLGLRVLKNDPPRERAEGENEFVSLAQIAQEADIITFHTPLYKSGIDKTYHLCDAAFMAQLKPDAVIINAARGGILDEAAWLCSALAAAGNPLVIDCWENEPDINLELLHKVMLGTPHIAGYSLQGKANATTMSVQALSRFFGLGLESWTAEIPSELMGSTDYDMEADFDTLKNNPGRFEALRSEYKLRNVQEPDNKIM